MNFFLKQHTIEYNTISQHTALRLEKMATVLFLSAAASIVGWERAVLLYRIVLSCLHSIQQYTVSLSLSSVAGLISLRGIS